MSYKNYYKKSSWKAVCDRCGFLYHSDELIKEWNGLRVCKKLCYEPRHPQDFLRGKKDDQSVEWTRSEAADVETDTSGWESIESVPSGTFDNDL